MISFSKETATNLSVLWDASKIRNECNNYPASFKKVKTDRMSETDA